MTVTEDAHPVPGTTPWFPLVDCAHYANRTLRGMTLAATGHGTGDDAGPSDKENVLGAKEPIAAEAFFPDDDDEFEMEEIGEHGPPTCKS